MKNHSLLAKLGVKIKELRLEKNMTQQRLASQSGLEKSRISKIESGRLNSTVQTLGKLSRALEVPIVDFFKE